MQDYTLTLLNKDLKKLQKQFFKIEKQYEATEDIALYFLLDSINDKKSSLCAAIEKLENLA